MIVRILGEGQYDVPDTARGRLGELEATLNSAVDGDDDGAFSKALAAVIAEVRSIGALLPPDSFTASDLVVPFSDATLSETKSLLDEPGGERV